MKHKGKSIKLGKSIVSLTSQLFILTGVATLVIFATIQNTLSLDNFIEKHTEEHIQDAIIQLATDITMELRNCKTNLNLVADSLGDVSSTLKDEQDISQFLDAKAKISPFTKIFFVESENYKNLPDYALRHPFTGSSAINSGISYDQNQNLVYTLFTDGTKGPVGVLIGIRDRAEIQKLISPRSFGGHNTSYIIDSNGNIIISASEKDESTLHNILESQTPQKDYQETLSILKKNMSEQTNCTVRMDTAQGVKDTLIITYNNLDVNDWGLLTITPANIISDGFNTYVAKTIALSLVLILSFIIIMIISYLVYQNRKKHLEKLAFSDPITKGLNGLGFQVQYQNQLLRQKWNEHAILLMNVKNFKLINLQFGTRAGDKTLRYIYDTISSCLNKNEFVSRNDADNFFVYLNENDQEVIKARADDFCTKINSFNSSESKTQYTLAIQKSACIVKDETIPITLIQDHVRQAYDKAISLDTEECIFYEKSFTDKQLRAQELNNLFKPSIKNKDFKVYLQPKIQLNTGLISGAEVLVRWIHPEKGLIFPSDFIPLFEKNGRVCQLDFYMLEETCILLSKWHKEGRKLFPVSVNLSRQHYLKNPNFLEDIYSITSKYEIPPGIIELELTESIFFDTTKFEDVKKSIDYMHEKGFLCSLDDFGAGFSSLGLLKEFDIDTIKFDRQFFLDISTKKAKDIIKGLLELSYNLGIHTVAEGIETEEQLALLRETKCDMIQGYYFSKPLPVTDFEKFWTENEKQ